MPTPPRTPHSHRPVSRFARYALAAYGVLIVYASLYPFAGWRWQGFSPFDFVTAPLPRYLTASDLLINVSAMHRWAICSRAICRRAGGAGRPG